MHSSFYVNILEPRRNEIWSGFFMYRELNPTKSYRQNVDVNPRKHQDNVLKSFGNQEIIRKICQEKGLSQAIIERQICDILNEIGFKKELITVRWLGWVLTKLFVKALQGILVNEASIFNLKSLMGNCPIVLVPSHRSYLDFTVMSYLCFHYDIKLPAIAAGIDFQGMAVFGELLRQVGAFYMRRSFTDTDKLYWQIFQEYITEIVTKGDQPIEFFIEGTRSRTGKSLYPKFGLLSMILKSFLISQVPDILFVPINISYDRIMEERLFAFELLGVPKPKETTKGFFQSLRYLHQDYGNVHVTFSSPISALNFFNGKIDRSIHNLEPSHSYLINNNEREVITQFAFEILDSQQKHSPILPSNLFATVLLSNYSRNHCLSLIEAEEEIYLLKALLITFGAQVNFNNFEESLRNVLEIHKNLIYCNDNKLKLVKNNDKLVYTATADSLRGHKFLENTMNYAVPFILLQEYINPLMYFLINPAFIVFILNKNSTKRILKKEIFDQFNFLKTVFSYEFVGFKGNVQVFDDCLNRLSQLQVIKNENDEYCLGDNFALISLFEELLEPFVITYFVVASNIQKGKEISEKEIIKTSQSSLEQILINNKIFINPYVLSLNTISNCIFSLSVIGVIKRIKINNSVLYHANPDKLTEFIIKIGSYLQTLPALNKQFFEVINIQSKI